MIKQVREERMTEISITELGESWCTAAVAKQLLGLDFEDSHLAGMTKTWCVRYLGIDPFHQREGLWIDRHAAETFLLQESLTSWRNAAIYLGMSEDDLHKTVDRLAARDMYNMIEVSKNEQLVHKREVAHSPIIQKCASAFTRRFAKNSKSKSPLSTALHPLHSRKRVRSLRFVSTPSTAPLSGIATSFG
jgi:hypothetical protein